MRTTALSFVLTALVAGCASTGPSSASELRAAALDALEAGDAQAYANLIFTADRFKRACPNWDSKWTAERLDKMVAKTREAVAKSFAGKCSLVKGKERPTLSPIGPPTESDSACPQIEAYDRQTVVYRSEVVVDIRGMGGNSKLGVWGLVASPRCKKQVPQACVKLLSCVDALSMVSPEPVQTALDKIRGAIREDMMGDAMCAQALAGYAKLPVAPAACRK